MKEAENDEINNDSLRDKYICPVPECNLIPEIVNIRSDTGKIALKCKKGHFCELDVLAYLKILDEERNISPENSNNINSDSKDELSSKEVLKKKENEISDIIEINKLYLNSQEIYPGNVNYNKCIINLGKYLEEENNRWKDIDAIIKEEIEDNKENEKKAIQKLEENYQIYLGECCEKEQLLLKLKGPKNENKYKWLRDEGFKLISQIRFKNLIEINLSNNKITDIYPLNRMLLPHLETINFSYNEIIDISPIANLLSDKLLEIYLENNKINDLGPFLNSNFPLLKILRVDGNNKAIKNKSFKTILKKYKDIIVYEIKKWDYFIEKYNSNLKKYEDNLTEDIYQKLEKLELGSNRCGDKLIKDLFPLVNSPNKIRYLYLDDNKLQDLSLLTRMPLYHLEKLDLSLNFIINIRFLKKMSEICRGLKTLYLNDNKINDISPLVKFKDGEQVELIFNLECLTLKNNNLDLKDKTTYNIIDKLVKNEKFAFDYEKNDLIK